MRDLGACFSCEIFIISFSYKKPSYYVGNVTAVTLSAIDFLPLLLMSFLAGNITCQRLPKILRRGQKA